MIDHLTFVCSDREFNAKKNQAVVFAGVIDGHNYLLDINDSGSFHAKGGQYIVICTEDTLKVSSAALALFWLIRSSTRPPSSNLVEDLLTKL